MVYFALISISINFPIDSYLMYLNWCLWSRQQPLRSTTMFLELYDNVLRIIWTFSFVRTEGMGEAENKVFFLFSFIIIEISSQKVFHTTALNRFLYHLKFHSLHYFVTLIKEHLVGSWHNLILQKYLSAMFVTLKPWFLVSWSNDINT